MLIPFLVYIFVCDGLFTPFIYFIKNLVGVVFRLMNWGIITESVLEGREPVF